jgi:hypothetical protein
MDDFLELYHRMEAERLIHDLPNEEDIMKLFLCKKCADVVRCFDEKRTCKCGASSGYYTDDANAVFIGKDCVPLGFANSKLIKAVNMAEIENKHQKDPTACKGVDFASFVILECSTSIKKE